MQHLGSTVTPPSATSATNELRNCLQPSAATSSPSMLSRSAVIAEHISVEEATSIKDMFEKRDLSRVFIGCGSHNEFRARHKQEWRDL